jgi:hypothetical protein
MEIHDRIYLIDMGGEIAWCDSPDPGADMDPDDAVAYVLESKLSEAQETIDQLKRMIKSAHIDEDCAGPSMAMGRLMKRFESLKSDQEAL